MQSGATMLGAPILELSLNGVPIVTDNTTGNNNNNGGTNGNTNTGT